MRLANPAECVLGGQARSNGEFSYDELGSGQWLTDLLTWLIRAGPTIGDTPGCQTPWEADRSWDETPSTTWSAHEPP